jgi:hypothetical protein
LISKKQDSNSIHRHRSIDDSSGVFMMPHLSSDDNDNNVCYNTSVDATPSTHTSFNIHKENTTKKKEAPAATPPFFLMRNPKHVAKGFLLFVVSVAATGFLYMASQAVVSATATTGGYQEYIETRWWFKVDAIELLFYLFVLSALFHFVVNAGGGSKIKHCSIFVPLILTTGIILVVVAPGVYQQAHNGTVNIQYDRGGCHPFHQVDKKFGLLKAYPSLHIKRDRFLQYNFNNRTDVETRVFIDGLGRMVAIADADLLRQMAISTSIPGAERQRLLLLKIKSFLVKECAYKMLDVMCADRFKLVRCLVGVVVEVWLCCCGGVVFFVGVLMFLLFLFLRYSATCWIVLFPQKVVSSRTLLHCCMIGKHAEKKNVHTMLATIQIGAQASTIKSWLMK